MMKGVFLEFLSDFPSFPHQNDIVWTNIDLHFASSHPLYGRMYEEVEDNRTRSGQDGSFKRENLT